MTFFLHQVPYFVCPIEYSTELEQMTMSCEPSLLFRQQVFFGISISDLKLAFQIQWLFSIQEWRLPFQTLRTWARLLINKETLAIYPFFIHAFWMSLFASIIGPFGGFFASGFKRAFKIKDFGDIIPGHGGIMDRYKHFLPQESIVILSSGSTVNS